MATKKLKDSELKSILAEVEAEIGDLLKSEGAALRKAKGDEAPGEEAAASPGEEAAEASAPGGDEGSDPSAAPAEGSAPDAGGPPPADAAPAPELSAPAPEAAVADPATDAAADPEALLGEYKKLSPEALKMHYMAAKAALFEVMGAADAGGAPGAGAPPAGPPGMPPAGPEASAPMPPPAPAAAAAPLPPPAPDQLPPPALKAEVPATMTKNPANGGTEKGAIPAAIKSEAAPEGTPLKKSEDAEKLAELEAQVGLMAKAFDAYLGTPIRKAVTSVAYLPKTDDAATPAPSNLSKSEIDEKISEALRSGKLNKSQKEKVVSYSMGHLKFEQIQDLLK